MAMDNRKNTGRKIDWEKKYKELEIKNFNEVSLLKADKLTYKLVCVLLCVIIILAIFTK